ncbi:MULTISPECIES: DNA mismatch repair protein MutS [unclassified Bacillus (in: firmicutes)]|uniref:DNA mismatch repair protein MutS n=1 Tax=unclassified Bacillus (in: firmicutes) TaxID=185979 RepID=UPI0008F2FB28|nr:MULTISPECIES: DNA mismatch repair protein MutS [unclassified Bacillus (in: firmicutes)]SFA72798.1 DNA mismatch repair protein MutS [Bacillus sp. UNCCL13]SFQ62905.1 DNA mismatch repair protein MutS [Bacillus sp. cl95]
MAAYTPMIQQYLKIKAEYQDAFLFFRLGDFYEMFFDDAINASQELEITLTSREGGGSDRVPMCGVPYHSAPNYIEQLVERGYKVAICEQTEDPRQAKGVVRREVVQLITPGTVMDGRGLSEKENNYLAAITAFNDQTFGFAYNDLSTGENRVTLLTSGFDEVLNELAVLGAKETVIASDFSPEWQKKLRERGVLAISIEDETKAEEHFLPLMINLNQDKMVTAVARMFHYLYRTQKRSLDHLQPVTTYQTHHFMKIDYFSKRNLELTETIRSKGKKGSLLWLLDETMTAMGGRMLKQWIDRPLIDRQEIERRHGLVEVLIQQYFERQELREKLKEVYDLERLAGRVAFGNVNARDLVQLKKSLLQVPQLQAILTQLTGNEVQEIAGRLDPCDSVTDLLERALVENPPLSLKEGNMIRDGYNDQLDQYRYASRNGKTWIAQLEREEREKTGIKSLKIGYNRVFGYYIEVTRSNLHLLQEGQYERKQTLANAERFITPELKEKETLILQAEEKSGELEYALFAEIREMSKEYIPRLQALAKTVSELDVLQCFAQVSEDRRYVKPQFSEERRVAVKEGRHPVVEKVLNAQEYVPNDCFMDREREALLITGPNMSGKSTYMRQIALTAILAQIGCYVPATEAILPIFDQVFTRIGAADDLISGQSTFMVEMLEAKNAIANATQNSLILFDEIGRGTSTYDGMALAQAIIEYIHNRIGAKTLFSTHYHELTVLEEELPNLKNIHVSAVEHNGKVVFLHKIKEGAADKSYGIHVAQLAELPEELIERANEILLSLEQQDQQGAAKIQPSSAKKEKAKPLQPVETVKIQDEDAQLSFFDATVTPTPKVELNTKEKKIVEQIKGLDILDLTPLQAINTLYELQKKLKS